MEKWLYKNKVIESLKDLDKIMYPLQCFGFVYLITQLSTNKKYIGRKNLATRQNIKLGKKELIKLKEERKRLKMRGRAPSKKLVVKESNWLNYWSSNKPLKEFIKKEGKNNFKREILKLAHNKKHLTYLETKYLFKYEILEKPEKYFNVNILGKFFTKDFLES